MKTYRTKNHIRISNDDFAATFKRDDAVKKLDAIITVDLPDLAIFHYGGGHNSLHVTYGQWLKLAEVMRTMEYEVEGEICWIEEAEYDAMVDKWNAEHEVDDG